MCVVIKNKLLSDLPLGASGRILEVGDQSRLDHDNHRTISRLFHLGFLPDQEITVTNIAPIVAEPILVKISQGYIALTRSEAALVVVEEV